MKRPARFVVYLDDGHKWRWQLRAANGRIIAASGESFASLRNALRAVRAVRRVVTAP